MNNPEQLRTDMNKLHYINRVEYCEAKDLASMVVVKKKYGLVPASDFIKLEIVGLASVEIADKIENKERLFTSKLTVFLPDRLEVGNKKLCFRLRSVTGECFIMGTGSRPYALLTSTRSCPDSPSSRCGNAMIATLTDTVPLLEVLV